MWTTQMSMNQCKSTASTALLTANKSNNLPIVCEIYVKLLYNKGDHEYNASAYIDCCRCQLAKLIITMDKEAVSV